MNDREKMFNLKLFFSSLLLLMLSFNALAQDVKTIAFAQDNMANDFRKAQVFEVQNALSSTSNIKFVYSDAKGRTSLLISQIDKFISQNIDLIIVGTNDASAVVPVVSKAYKKGIPVIILDRGIEGKEYTTFINSDNIKIGQIGAKFIAKQLKDKGKVLLLEGIQTADVTQLRSKGFMDEIMKHKEIEVIKRTGNYLRRDTIMEMEKLIEEGIEFDAIFAHSDSMISGARTVMKKNKVNLQSIITVGCDFTSEAQQAIVKDEQTASIKFPLGGEKAAEIAIKILSGENVSSHISIPVTLVTKENVNKIKPIF